MEELVFEGSDQVRYKQEIRMWYRYLNLYTIFAVNSGDTDQAIGVYSVWTCTFAVSIPYGLAAAASWGMIAAFEFFICKLVLLL